MTAEIVALHPVTEAAEQALAKTERYLDRFAGMLPALPEITRSGQCPAEETMRQAGHWRSSPATSLRWPSEATGKA